MVITNLHWAMRVATNIVLAAVPPHISAKTHVFSDNGASFLRTIIDEDSLEQKYGGNLPNKVSEFWPPRYNP